MTLVSPDLVPSVDLTLFDRSPEQLRTLAITLASAVLSEWVPREGNTEVVMTDAMALIVAELIFAINRVPTAVLDAVFALMELQRDTGAAATTSITFTLADNSGHTVPAGTRCRLDLQDGSVVFATDVAAVAAPGATTCTATATATGVGAAANGVTAGSPLSVVDQAFFVNSAAIASTVQLGRDPEDQASWETRAVQRLRTLTDVTVVNSQFTAFALEDPAVSRCLTIDTYDGSGGPPYLDTGDVTLVIYGAGGNVGTTDKATLLAQLQARVVAGVVIHLLDPTITNVAVTTAVVMKPGFVAGDVQAAITTALTAYLNPATWPWSATVRRNELIALIDSIAGVDYVASLTIPAADVTLTGDGPLANAGTITVTAT